MKQPVLIGQTDYTVLVLIRDTAGAPKTGLTEASVDIAYARVETDNDVTTTDVTPAALAALTDAHTDWGFEEVSATDHPGLYRLDLADAVFAAGAWSAVVSIVGTGLDPTSIEFVLVNFDPKASALPANAIAATSIANDAITAAKLAADVATEINAAVLAVLGALNDAAADGAVTTTDTMVAYLKQIINTLEGAPGIPSFPAAAVPGNAVSIAEVLRQIYDEVAGVNGATPLDAAGVRAAVGLASANLDTQLADIETKVDDVETRLGTPTDLGSGATVAANLVDIEGQTDNLSGIETKIDTVDTVVDAIKAKTDNLPSDPADQSLIIAATDAILAKLLAYVQVMVRKDAAIATDRATELTAINADEGAGAGAFDNTTDALEALRDRLQSAAADALAAYDPPTNSELEARTLVAANYATAAALATVDSLIDAIKAITDQFVFTEAGQVDATAVQVDDKTGYAIGTGGIAAGSFAASAVDAAALATDAVTEIVSAVFARAFPAAYGSHTFDELVKLMAAVLLGKASGLETTEATYRNLNDSGDAVVATVDEHGNRTAVTRTP